MFSVFVYFFFDTDHVIWRASPSRADDDDTFAAATTDESVLKENP